MSIIIELPWKAVPKARPRVTVNGTFMPPKYIEWKANVAELIRIQHPNVVLERPLSIVTHFGSTSTYVELFEYDTDFQRAKYVTGDVDNMLGSVMDALQDSGLIVNDRQVVRALALIERRGDDSEVR